MLKQKVKLRWHFLKSESGQKILDSIDGLYMFLHKSEIVYIGRVYYKSLRKRIQEHLRGDRLWKWVERNYDVRKISIKIAEIEDISQERINRKLVNDIESLLIVIERPKGNIQSIKTYRGRDLKVVNLGEKYPLRRTYSTDTLIDYASKT